MNAERNFGRQGRRVGVIARVIALASLLAAADVMSEPFPIPCRFDALNDSQLPLTRAVELALCSNAEVQAAGAGVRVRAAQVGEARARYWPSVTATASQVHQRARFPEASSATTDSAMTWYGGVSWILFDFGGRRADLQVAANLFDAALTTRDATIQRILGRVVEAYFDSVAAKALLDSKEQDTVLARETLASAERRLSRGDGTQNDSLQAQTALAKAALELNRGRAAHEKSLAVLAYMIGLPTETTFSVIEDVDVPSIADEQTLSGWLEQTRERHPAISAARAEVLAARAQTVAARASAKPTVDLRVNHYGNGFPQEGLDANRQRSMTVGIAVTIPLFDGFMNRYRVREAEATVEVKEALRIDTERVTLTDVVKAHSDATATVANLRQSLDLLETAQKSQASSRRRYDAGATNISELLSTQRALADARQERVRSLAEWRSAKLRLLAAAGLLESNGL